MVNPCWPVAETLNVSACAYFPSPGETKDMWSNPGGCWPANLINLASSRPVRNNVSTTITTITSKQLYKQPSGYCLREQTAPEVVFCPLYMHKQACMHAHIHTHTCTQIHIHTHTHLLTSSLCRGTLHHACGNLPKLYTTPVWFCCLTVQVSLK